MIDITQSYDSIANPQAVIFSGHSDSGNAWMLKEHDALTISFQLSDPSKAEAFRRAAIAAGLNVTDKW